MDRFAPLIGRICIALIFLFSGIGKIMDFGTSQEYMAQNGMPMTGLLLAGAIFLELAGGLSVLLGYRARIGAWLLILFLVVATLVFHTDFSQRMQIIQFLKNLAIGGGLLMIIGRGSGPYSLDGSE